MPTHQADIDHEVPNLDTAGAPTQTGYVDEHGRELECRTIGLERQRWLSLMLTMVQLGPCSRILELGTDPDYGYSGAMLERLSRGGTVHSVDETASVIRRAWEVQRCGYRPKAITFHHGPLRDGWSPDAPYDLIVTYSRFDWLPMDWLRQCAATADIILPLRLDDSSQLAFLHVNVQRYQIAGAQVLAQLDGNPRHTRFRTDTNVQLRPAHDVDGYTITIDRFTRSERVSP